MSRNMNKTTIALSAALALSVFFGGWLLVKNNSDKIEAAKEKSVLIAEKDLLTKEARDLALEKRKINDLNADQKKRIDDLMSTLNTKDAEISRLFANQANINDLRKKLKEIELVRNELKTEVDNLRNSLGYEKDTNKGLEMDVDKLRMENERLLAELMVSKSFQSNDFMVKGVKGNEKITAWARRTKVINFSFDFPASHLSELDVKIYTPDGKTYTTANKDLVSIAPMSTEAAPNAEGLTTKRMMVTLKPEKRFQKGIYRFAVQKSSENIATMQLQLK